MGQQQKQNRIEAVETNFYLQRIKDRNTIGNGSKAHRCKNAQHWATQTELLCLSSQATRGHRVCFHRLRSPAAIAEAYGLADRSSVYRHANALGLLQKRQRNIRAALERFIERAEDVDVTASAFVSAVQAYAKINSSGEWIDRSETVSMNDLFERMSSQELEEYAQTGETPDWFQQALGATADVGLPRIIVDL